MRPQLEGISRDSPRISWEIRKALITIQYELMRIIRKSTEFFDEIVRIRDEDDLVKN